MAKILAARGSQNVQCAEFTLNFDDTMLDVNGVEKDFGKTNAAATTFEVINLPREAVVVGGDLITETAFGQEYLVTVGDADVAARYMASTDKKLAARTALIPTGFRSEKNIRITITPGAVVAAGKMTLRVLFITPDRVTETNPL
jgi:hypothetical protein